MLLKKSGFPEEDELVLCTITNIQYHSVFAEMDEYGKTGMIHISEVAPGRIRNIRDFVKEGKKVVCKVLNIHQDKGHIDLSLRRVNEAQKRNKLNEIKQEQLAEKIIEFVSKKNKKKLEDVFKTLSEKLLAEYDTLFEAFEAVTSDLLNLKKIGIDAGIAKDLEETIKQRIKPHEYTKKGVLTLKSFEPNGVEIIHNSVKKARKIKDDFLINYLGAGNYSISVTSDSYKISEKILSKVAETIAEEMEKHKSTATFAVE